jgi:hypothetical protein
MNTEETIKDDSFAPLWGVRYKTNDDMFHPIRFGEKGSPPISRNRIKKAAEDYLLKNNEWLIEIDEIHPIHDD